ncbi:MAG: hypothetical protein ACQERC_07675 [Bacteroidota bacterium]
MKYPKDLYEQKLNEFFDRHDPEKKAIAKKIVERFPERQEDVFNHLTAIYAKKEGTDEFIISDDSILSVPTGPNSGVG